MTCDSCGCETDVRLRYRDADDEVLRVCPDCYADLMPTRDKDREP